MNPAPRHAQTFTFCAPERQGDSIHMHYRLDDTPLTEILYFPDAPDLILKEQQRAFEQALELLSLIAGISYYKAGLARNIAIEGLSVTEDTASFLRNLYQHGLAEMLWKAGLEHFEVPAFPVTQQRHSAPADFPLNRRNLLAMGGGKDSMLSAHLLKAGQQDTQAAFVGHSSLIAHSIEVAGLPALQIRRKLDPKLSLLNEQGAFNGHVPVTAINSAILVLAALLYDHDRIIFSNEHSANEANFINTAGRAVNHQYSKSLAFEQAFARQLNSHIHPTLQYVSLLRPWNETRILQLFSQLPQYHLHFSSCNRNFHLQGSRNSESLWCGQCPKCHFTFLGLAAFLPETELMRIFGRNLLQDRAQIGGFAALAALGHFKPLECVGTVEESRALLAHLQAVPNWQSTAVLQALQGHPELAQARPLEEILQRRYPHRLPPDLEQLLPEHALV